MNFTVVRDHPEQSFHVNMRGALNVMQAAVEHGIKKVIHSGPQFVRSTYDHDFDIADVPPVLTTGLLLSDQGLGERDLPDVRAGRMAFRRSVFCSMAWGRGRRKVPGTFRPLRWCGRICIRPVGWRWKFHKCRTAFRSSTCLAGRDTGSTMLIRPDASWVLSRRSAGERYFARENLASGSTERTTNENHGG